MALRSTRSCPGCGFLITKDGGCDHLMCQKCKHEFCWLCGNDNYGYKHVNKSDCWQITVFYRVSLLITAITWTLVMVNFLRPHTNSVFYFGSGFGFSPVGALLTGIKNVLAFFCAFATMHIVNQIRCYKRGGNVILKTILRDVSMTVGLSYVGTYFGFAYCVLWYV
jgi:hypothetical protein